MLKTFYENCRSDIKDSFKIKTYNANDIIIQQGSESKHVYLIMNGNVKVNILNRSGVSLNLSVSTAWNLFGELEVFNSKPYVCYVQAMSSCLVAEIENTVFFEWIKSDFLFSRFIYTRISDKFFELHRVAITNITYPIEYRFLMLLLNNIGLTENKPQNLTKDLIAEILGTSIRSVNRIIKDLSDKSIIKYNKGIIIICSKNKFLEELRKFEIRNDT